MRLQIADCRLQIGLQIGRRLAVGALALWLGSAPVRAEIIDRVLAVAAGELIMLSDVTAARDLGLSAPGSGPDPIGAVLSSLIDRELVLAEVDRYAPPEPGRAAIDRELEAVRNRFPTPAAFAAALARSGIDEPRLRETLRQNLRIQEYESQRFTVAPPADEDVARYYREHAAAFTRDGAALSLDAARADVVRALSEERRARLVAEWIAGLRRRADIVDLYHLR